MGLYILIGAGVVVLVLIILLIVKGYRQAGPNEALIISGGRKRTVVEPDGTRREIGYRIQIGGGALVWPFINKLQILPLDVFTLEVETADIYTAQGIPVTIASVAQVKVNSDEHAIRRAAEQFLGKGLESMRKTAYQILDGHIRAVMGSMSIEDVYKDRETFAQRVLVLLERDLGKLGLEALSFAPGEIRDAQGYLEALGRPKVAQVKRDAAIAEAEAQMDTVMKTAKAKKEGEIARIKGDAEIAEASRDYELKRADFQASVNEKKAKADLSYELERQKLNQSLKKEEYQVRLIEKDLSTKLEEQEIKRKERELEATVKKPAEARKFQLQAEADAESYRIAQEAKGKAQAEQAEGEVKANLAKLQGFAEAEAMQKKAEAWRDYSQAAVFDRYISILPELAKAVAEPLAKVEKIVMVNSGQGSSVGASKITQEVSNVLAQLPPVVEALSGVDVRKLIEKIPQIRQTDEPPDKQEKQDKKGR
jgi:flotillin